jgi:hypothetical protein
MNKISSYYYCRGYIVSYNVPFGINLASNVAPCGGCYRLQSFYRLITFYLQMMSFMANTKSAGVDAEAGNTIKVNKNIANGKSEAGYTWGINSGWNFNEEPFKEMFGPAAAIQLNKNIKMYK